MLTHYVQRRLLVEKTSVDASDELDWFGNYLLQGLFFDDSADEHTTLGTFTTAIDDYYAHQFGVREAPADKPRQSIPLHIRMLIERLELVGVRGFVDAGCLLLEGSGEARKNFALEIAERRRRAKRKGFSAVRTRFGNSTLAYAAALEPTQAFVEEYVRAAKHQDRADHVICICEDVRIPNRLLVAAEHAPWAEDSMMAERSQKFFASLANGYPPDVHA